MCTDRQRLYLHDLGVDPTAPLDGLPKEVASEWIGELKELRCGTSPAPGWRHNCSGKIVL